MCEPCGISDTASAITVKQLLTTKMLKLLVCGLSEQCENNFILFGTHQSDVVLSKTLHYYKKHRRNDFSKTPFLTETSKSLKSDVFFNVPLVYVR